MDEREALLNDVPATQDDSESIPPTSNRSRITKAWRSAHTFASDPQNKILAYVFAIYVLSDFGLLTLEIPATRLFERTVCRNHYDASPNVIDASSIAKDIDEQLCKIPVIQKEVAKISGWLISMLAIPTLLTAVLYGSLSDRYGRKPILGFACLGELLVLVWIVFVCYFDCIFPVRLVWLSSLFMFIGGGQRVLVSMLFIMLTDTVDQKRRTRDFYFLAAGPHISGFIGPAIVAGTMSASVWLPFALAITGYLVILLLIFIMPETRPKIDSPAEPLLDGHLEISNADNEEVLPRDFNSVTKILTVPNVAICFALFFIKRTSFLSEKFFYQYASAKFDLELRQTPWFDSGKSLAGIILLSFILPSITTTLQRYGQSSPTIDLGIIRGSFALMVVAFFAVWVATSPLLFALAILMCGLGEGIDPGIQGLLSTFVTLAQRAKAFTMIAMTDATGKIVGGPLMAALFSAQLDDKGHSTGLCFLIASCFFGCGLLLSVAIRLQK